MLYSFFGTDVIKARAEAQDFISSQKEKSTRIVAGNWSAGFLQEAAGGSSLFGGTDVFVLDTPSEHTDFSEYVYKNLKLFAESPNTFVLIEGPLRAAEKKKVGKYSETSGEYTVEKDKPFNVFSLGDALVRRDKKALWMLYTEARTAGIEPENIIGTLFWQVKMLVLASKTGSADEAGVSAFPYTKAKRALHNFTEQDLEQMLHSLITIYHEGHLGMSDMDSALEKWILTR